MNKWKYEEIKKIPCDCGCHMIFMELRSSTEPDWDWQELVISVRPARDSFRWRLRYIWDTLLGRPCIHSDNSVSLSTSFAIREYAEGLAAASQWLFQEADVYEETLEHYRLKSTEAKDEYQGTVHYQE